MTNGFNHWHAGTGMPVISVIIEKGIIFVLIN